MAQMAQMFHDNYIVASDRASYKNNVCTEERHV